MSVDRLTQAAKEFGINIFKVRPTAYNPLRRVINPSVAAQLAPDVAKLDSINAETAQMQTQLAAMKDSETRRTRSALQPQSNLFSLLGQYQGRNTLG